MELIFKNPTLTLQEALKITRNRKGPVLIHAKVPLLNHHTSGVRMEWYRDDLDAHLLRDPLPILKELLIENGFKETELDDISTKSEKIVLEQYKKALKEKDPEPDELFKNIFAPTKV